MNNRQKTKTTAAIALSGALAASNFAPATAVVEEYLTVTNCDNSGAGSLREAITNAPYFSYIEFDISCNEIVLETAVEFLSSVTILGPGSDELTITNSATSDNGLFKAMINVSSVSINNVRLQSNSVEDETSESLIYSEGGTSFAFNRVEITGTKSALRPIIDLDGLIRIGESSFFDNNLAGTSLLRTGSLYVANSSFVGNTIYEGSLIETTDRIFAINSAFVDNFPSENNDRSTSALIKANSSYVSIYSTYFVDDNITDEDQITLNYLSVDDRGANLYAVNPSLTSINGVTNTAPGNGASAIVTRAAMKLGVFGRIDEPDEGMSANQQQLLAGSAAVDTHTFEQIEAVNNTTATEFGTYLIVDYDAVGFRRGYNTLYDAGPVEYVPSGDEEEEPTTITKTRKKSVFFNAMSSTLTKDARKVLRKMVSNLPEDATNVKVKLVGFVQPANFSWNNVSLSNARTKSVQQFMKKLGVKAAFQRVARGQDKDSTAKARRVEVTVRFSQPVD